MDGSSPLGNGNGVELSAGTHGNTVGAANVIRRTQTGFFSPVAARPETPSRATGSALPRARTPPSQPRGRPAYGRSAREHHRRHEGAAARNVISGNTDGGVSSRAPARVRTSSRATMSAPTWPARAPLRTTEGLHSQRCDGKHDRRNHGRRPKRDLRQRHGSPHPRQRVDEQQGAGELRRHQRGGTAALGNTQFGIGTDAERTMQIQGNVVSGTAPTGSTSTPRTRASSLGTWSGRRPGVRLPSRTPAKGSSSSRVRAGTRSAVRRRPPATSSPAIRMTVSASTTPAPRTWSRATT